MTGPLLWTKGVKVGVWGASGKGMSPDQTQDPNASSSGTYASSWGSPAVSGEDKDAQRCVADDLL